MLEQKQEMNGGKEQRRVQTKLHQRNLNGKTLSII